MNQRICFIGAGNMATSLIGGLCANHYQPSQISACDINQQQLEKLAQAYGVSTSSDALDCAGDAEIVLLAVKPQVMREVCLTLSALANNPQQLFISIAAGVPTSAIDNWLGSPRSIVRCMPNTPALLRLGATGLFANAHISAAQKDSAQKIMEAVGISLWVDSETDLDAVTAISGSGPAYFFYFIELLEQAGVKLGLPVKTAARLARQTALGAASMAQDGDIAELRARVTSKNGTTEQAILSFQNNQLAKLVDEATAAAHRRSLELADELTQTQG